MHPHAYYNDKYTVELHHDGTEYIIDLKQFYRSAVRKVLNKVKVWKPPLIELFIYSCVHLMHHKPVKNWTIPSLRILLDIRESYYKVIDLNKKNELIKKINFYEQERVVGRAIALTEKVYDDFFDWNIIHKSLNVSIDWEEKNWESKFINRLLTPQKEYNRLLGPIPEIYSYFLKDNEKITGIKIKKNIFLLSNIKPVK